MCLNQYLCHFSKVGQMADNHYCHDGGKVSLEECQTCGDICIKTSTNEIIRNIRTFDTILAQRIDRHLDQPKQPEIIEIRKVY